MKIQMQRDVVIGGWNFFKNFKYNVCIAANKDWKLMGKVYYLAANGNLVSLVAGDYKIISVS